MSTNLPGRRDFLRRFAAAGALGIGASSVLAACGGTESTPSSTPSAEAPAAAAAGGCTDVSGLSEQEVAMRTQLQYADVTAIPEKNCENCALFIAPAAGANCGGCQLLKGPIAGNGYCISWAPKQT